MTQDFKIPATADQVYLEKMRSLNTVGTISYVLHLVVAVSAIVPGGQFGPVLLIAALILDMVNREQAVDTWHASHFRWRIRTVLIAAALYLATFPLWLLLLVPGWMAWTAISIWFLYRIVTGFMSMNKGQEIGTQALGTQA
jgi:uncharacterized membrane protein